MARMATVRSRRTFRQRCSCLWSGLVAALLTLSAVAVGGLQIAGTASTVSTAVIMVEDLPDSV